MNEFYLCSRSEFVRTVNMDTGRRLAIIGAHERFLSWIDMALPSDVIIKQNIDELNSTKDLDIILFWSGEVPPDMGKMNELRKSLSGKGELWLVTGRKFNVESGILSTEGGVAGKRLQITPELDLVLLDQGA